MKKTNVTALYAILCCVFTTCILMSNIIAAKMIQVGPWSLTAGVIIFPLTYIIGDIVTEVYGFKAMRRLVWTGFSMNLLMVIIFTIAMALPAPGWFENSEAFNTTLGSTPRLLLAGFVAFILGSWVNATVLSKLKVAAMQKKGYGRGSFSFRAIISTVAGEIVDSCLFVPIAFIGNIPLSALPAMIILQVCFKSLYEIVILPVTGIAVRKVKEYDGIDTYDVTESYKLFGSR